MQIRIVNWNCQGGFRKKYHLIMSLRPDICIIQECEDPCKFNDANYHAFASCHLWVGANKNKGLGVFSTNGEATLVKHD